MRSRSSAKKAGSSFERLIADYLAQVLEDDRIDRRVKTGNKDRGDIAGVRTIRGGRVVIECKNVSRDNLPQWIREAEVERGNDDAAVGVVAHKRHGVGAAGAQYVSMTLDTFISLLQGGLPDLRGVSEAGDLGEA
jgi:hypothetical protein